MFGSPGHPGMSSAVQRGNNASPMTWEEALACFGGVIGIMIFVYLLCRCCQYMDPMQNPQERRHERREDLNEPILGEPVNAVVRRQTVVLIPPPSAESEPQFYSNFGTFHR